VVGLPNSSTFNETVAMDLKTVDNVTFIHMIDLATRYSMAAIVKDKNPETIIQAIFQHWISYFGCPKKFLTEFNNDHF